MNAASKAASSAHVPAHALAGVSDRAVPAHARELAARLSALFERDVEIVARLNDAQHHLANANERLYSGLAPDASVSSTTTPRRRRSARARSPR